MEVYSFDIESIYLSEKKNNNYFILCDNMIHMTHEKSGFYGVCDCYTIIIVFCVYKAIVLL